MGYCETPHSQGRPRFPCRIQGCRPSRCRSGAYGPPPSSLSRSQELGLGLSFRAGEPLSGVGAVGPQRLLTSSGQSLTAKCCRSLSEPSRLCPKLRPRRYRGIPKITEKLRRAMSGAGISLPSNSEASRTVSRPRLTEIAEVYRAQGSREVLGFAGREGEQGRALAPAKASPEESEICRAVLADERLRKEPKVADQRWAERLRKEPKVADRLWAERLRSGPKAPERPPGRTAGGGRSAMFDAPLLQ